MSDLNNVKVILFDLDGTLIDSVPQLYLAVQAALKSNQLSDVSIEQVRDWIGNGADVLLKRAICQQYHFTDIDEVLFQQVKSQFDHYYQMGIDSDYSLYPAVKETLSVLAQAGYSMAVVTNKPDQFVQPLLQSAGIAEFFTYTLGGIGIYTSRAIFNQQKLFNICPVKISFSIWELIQPSFRS